MSSRTSVSPEPDRRTSSTASRRVGAAVLACAFFFCERELFGQDAAVEPAAAGATRDIRLALDGKDDAQRKLGCASADALPMSSIDQRLGELANEKDDSWDGVFRRIGEVESKGPDILIDEIASGTNPVAAVESLCLLRAAFRSKRVAGMHVLVHHSGDHRSSFRPYVARALHDAGDVAIPALILARKEPVSETRRWAYNTLEDAKRRLPGDAVQTKDYGVLAEILRVFAELRDQDAVPVIAAFVNSDRTIVRVAARQALLDYGQGALWKLRETYSNLLGTQALENWKAEEVAERLYKALDKIRLEDVYVLLDEGLELGKAGDLEGALQRFDQALAREPLLDRRDETGRYYYLMAKNVREADRARARALLEKARFVGTKEPDKSLVESEIALLDGLDSIDRGTPNAARFEDALRLDPSSERARSELAKLRKMVETPANKTRRYGIAACLLVAAVALALLFGKKREAPRSAA